MKIVGWLKSKIRRWLLEDGTDMSLECLVPTVGQQTERITFVVTSSRGMFLVGTGQSGHSLQQQLLPVGAAVDPERWWILWRKFNPKAKVEWADGPDTPPNRLGGRSRPS